MFSVDIDRLYTGLDINNLPSSAGYHYANSLFYYTRYGTESGTNDRNNLISVFKWVSPYAPYTKRACPKFSMDQMTEDYTNMYSDYYLGQQGVIMMHGWLSHDDSFGGQSWDFDRLVYDNFNGTRLAENRYNSTGHYYGNIIVDFNPANYVLVPTIRALRNSESDMIWEGEFGAYRAVANDYPYIVRIGYKFYYKSNLSSNSVATFADMHMIASGATYTTCNDWGLPVDGRQNWKTTWQLNMVFCVNEWIYRSPALMGKYSSGLPYIQPYGYSNGTHGVEICDGYAPLARGMYGWQEWYPVYYINIDTAIKIINATGFKWCETAAATADYHGLATTSASVHMPKILSDGTTTETMWTGSEIGEHWLDDPSNSDYYYNIGDISGVQEITLHGEVNRLTESDNVPIDYGTDALEPDTPLLSGYGLFANYFALNKNMVLSLSDFLWQADESIIDDVINSLKLFGQNPINAIMSLRLYPFNVYSLIPSPQGEEIVLGRVSTGVGAYKLTNVTSTTLDLGKIWLQAKFGNFLDYAPYTSYNLYIPFVGTVNLNPNDVLNHMINVKMIADLTTGKCTAIIYADGIPIQYQDGMIGVEIPITAENMGQTASAVISAIGATAGAAITGNAVGAAMVLASGAADVAFNDVSINKTGNVSPAAALSAPINCYVVISRPNIVKPPNYGHSVGYACDMTAKISNLSGYTVCRNVDTTGISATEAERKEIKQLLEGGVYL